MSEKERESDRESKKETGRRSGEIDFNEKKENMKRNI